MQSKEKFDALPKEKAELLLKILVMENQGSDLPDTEEMPLISRIVKKRIEGLKLPVIIKNTGLLAVNCFAVSPGQAVTVLVDFLEKFEGKEFTATHLCAIYPWGFYNEKAFEEYVENVLKPKKSKWSTIY